jgi:hypothetical protein
MYLLQVHNAKIVKDFKYLIIMLVLVSAPLELLKPSIIHALIVGLVDNIMELPVGQYLDSNSGVCVCPPTLNWNGQSCIPCFSGRVWDASSKSC